MDYFKSMAKKERKIPEEAFDAVFDAIATTSKGLRTICKELKEPFFPFYKKITTDDLLKERYARAKEEQADNLADEMIEIADDAKEDYETRIDSEGNETQVLNKEHVQRSKLRIDTRKWIASKLKPKKYGDKIEQDVNHKWPDEVKVKVFHTGANGNPDNI